MKRGAFDFQPATFDFKNKVTVENFMKKGMTREEAEAMVEDMKTQSVYRSTAFQVNVKDRGMLLELSIRRIDRQPIGDWRVKQRIKNAIAGEEAEAVELYPAESRLVDTANQYYLWVLKGKERFPFGFEDRAVSGPEEAKVFGAVQRAFT